MASYVPCKKNDANGCIFYVSLVSQADVRLFQVNPTLAAGDFKIAVDDAAPGNLGTLPVIDADFTRRVKFVLSQAETNGDNLTIICSDAAGAEWCDLTINIQTSAQTLDELDIVADAIKAVTDVESGVKALVVTVDTVVDAIKVKTDNLPSGVAKNVALSAFGFLMVLSVDHITPATGKTITAEIGKDGGAFAACTNAVAEVSHGIYKIDLIQAEMNADVVVLKFSEAVCDQRTITITTS